MGKAFLYNCRVVVYFILLAGLLVAGPAVTLADDTVCARVKIEIKQELTLERQAFDAHMRINNGLANISLENVQIVVNFKDEDGNPVFASFDDNADPDTTGARFFISVDLMQNIDDIDGQGTIVADFLERADQLGPIPVTPTASEAVGICYVKIFQATLGGADGFVWIDFFHINMEGIQAD